MCFLSRQNNVRCVFHPTKIMWDVFSFPTKKCEMCFPSSQKRCGLFCPHFSKMILDGWNSMVGFVHGMCRSWWFVFSMVCFVHGMCCSWFVFSMVCFVQGMCCSWFVFSMVCFAHVLFCSWWVFFQWMVVRFPFNRLGLSPVIYH
mgnify:FL=1